MTYATQQMAADTVMRLRQLEAALRVLLVCDWENIRHLARNDLSPKTHYAELTALFLNADAEHETPYGNWLQQHFGTWPRCLLHVAIRQMRFDLRYLGTLEIKGAPPTVPQALLASTRAGQFRLRLGRESFGEMLREIATARMQLLLYHGSSKNWIWRNVVRDGWPIDKSFFIEDGEPLVEVSADLAEFTGASSGCWIDLVNRNDLDVEPVMEIFPDRRVQ